MFVVRHRGRVQGWRNACPHVAGAPMAWRKDSYLSADAQHIVCSAHGAQFNIDTGLCTRGPCVGESLSRVVVHEAEGDIYIVLEDSKETIL